MGIIHHIIATLDPINYFNLDYIKNKMIVTSYIYIALSFKDVIDWYINMLSTGLSTAYNFNQIRAR